MRSVEAVLIAAVFAVQVGSAQGGPSFEVASIRGNLGNPGTVPNNTITEMSNWSLSPVSPQEAVRVAESTTLRYRLPARAGIWRGHRKR